MQSRRLHALITAAVAATCLAVPVAQAPVVAGPGGPEVVLRPLPDVVRGEDATVTVEVRPHRQGRVVDLQVNVGGRHWRTVSTDETGSAGRAVLRLPTRRAPGRYDLRAVARPFRALDTTTSETGRLTVLRRPTGRTTALCAAARCRGSHLARRDLSADGRWAAYVADVDDLAPGDTDDSREAYLQDLRTGARTLLTPTTDGQRPDGGLWSLAVSADGSVVALASNADNLVDEPLPGARTHLFVWERASGELAVVRDAGGDPIVMGESASELDLSADGSLIAYTVDAERTPGNPGSDTDVFVVDRSSSSIDRVDLASDESPIDWWSVQPRLSADGRFVTFASNGTVTAERDDVHDMDVFVRDRLLGTTTLVSRAADGFELPGDDLDPEMSANGMRVLFTGETQFDDVWQTLLWRSASGDLRHVAVTRRGVELDTDRDAALSADGRYAVVATEDQRYERILPDDTNRAYDVFRVDLRTGRVLPVSRTTDGYQADDDSGSPVASADGRVVVFTSGATNLEPGTALVHEFG